MSNFLCKAWDFVRARKRIICILAPVVFGLIFMILCMMQLRQSIWFDESYSAYLTHYDYPKVWELTAQDVHPPLYYFALKTWAHFFGHTDFAMRMLSVVCGAVAILFAYLWLRYKYGGIAAIVATGLLSISPVFIRYGQEMRMYTMVLAIVFAATYVLQLAIDNGKKRWWVIYALLLAAGMWTHYFCALAWVVHLFYLITVYRKKIFQKKIILTYVGAVALYIPWIPSLFSQTGSVESGFWISEMSGVKLADYWSELLVYQNSTDLKNWLFVLVVLATITIFTLAIKTHAKQKLLLMLAIMPLALLILLSMPPFAPMFVPRYILFSIVAVSIISGVSLVLYGRMPLPRKNRDRAQRRRILVIAFSAIVLVSTSIIGVGSVYSIGNMNRTNGSKSTSRELYETIVALDNNENLAIICASEWLYYDMSFYSTVEHSVYFMNETMKYDMGSLYPLRDTYFGRIDDLDKFISKRDSFWYITTISKKTGKPAKTFPREDWTIREYSTVKLDPNSDTYAIVKMVKE